MVSGRVGLVEGCVLLAMATACGGADKEDYAKANGAILQELPTYPGSTVESRTDNPYFLSEQGPTSGYTTNVVYGVPADVTDEDVIQFYIDQLDEEWQHCREEVGIAEPVPTGASPAPTLGAIKLATFLREGAQVSLNTDGMHPLTRADTYEIAIDHDAPQDFCTGEDLR